MNANSKSKTSPPEPPQRPSPSPANLALAILFTGALFLNLWVDSQSSNYDGKYATPIIALLIAGVLGFDISKFWRGGS